MRKKKCGVREYWIVEIETRSIEVYWLKENKYMLEEVYTIYPDYEIEDMAEEEKANIKYEFATSLYSDMKIILDNVFNKVF